jgi:hypothetical protein
MAVQILLGYVFINYLFVNNYDIIVYWRIGSSEILVIVLVILSLFGGKKIPELMKESVRVSAVSKME